MKTVRELIKEAESKLDDEHKDVNVAKVLFYHLAKKEPHELYLMMNEEVEPELEKAFLAGMEEYYQGKPIQYIKGCESFFGRDFKVNEDVLIPRYETEELVENILYRIDDYFNDYKEIHLCDVGTGSGILGITALKLGAGHVVGTDLDPCAVPAVQDNKEANQIVDDTFDMMIGNIIDDKEVQDQVGYEKYDIVAANILADVLVPLTPVIVHQMKKGAYYITSGILDVKEEVVKEAVQKAGLTLVEVTRQGEWVCVTARKD